MSGPLKGFRILEVGHMLAGPYCGLLLADLGADVIKIEPPDGDIARTISPRSLGPYNEYFISFNRNKRSVVIDLATPEGQGALHKLAGDAHALISNLRPSAIRKLGLTYDALRQVNPKLVCVALTGFGLDGPHAERPAYDNVIQALTGLMDITGDPGSSPTKAGYSCVDNSTGIMAALGLVAKLLEGKGGQVDVAMYDVMLSQLNYLASAVLNGGGSAVKRYPQSSHPYIVPAQVFETRKGWLVLFITHDKFWRIFCEEVGRPAWCTEPIFATMAARQANRAVVISALSELLREADAETWAARLIPLGIVAAPVCTLDEALKGNLAAERKMIVEMATPFGSLRSVGNPIKTDQADEPHRLPPLLGQHTGEILGKVS